MFNRYLSNNLRWDSQKCSNCCPLRSKVEQLPIRIFKIRLFIFFLDLIEVDPVNNNNSYYNEYCLLAIA